MAKYANRGFPNIVGNIFVSATTGENVAELKELIYSKAVKAKDQGEAIIGRLVRTWRRYLGYYFFLGGGGGGSWDFMVFYIVWIVILSFVWKRE